VSYRREDTEAHVDRLSIELRKRFGRDHVFMDIDSITPGGDFVKVIGDAVSSCEILIAVIGKHWVSSIDEKGRRRLDDPNDFVRLEIRTALQRNIRLIPILVQGMPMPKQDELPDDLAELARRQAVELSRDHWDEDVKRLLDRLSRKHRMKEISIAAVFIVAIIIGIVILLQFLRERKSASVNLGQVAATSSSPSPPSSFTNKYGMKMVYIGPGSFTMGSKGEGAKNEEDPHPVTIGYGFYMGESEVTQGQWQQVMKTSVHQQFEEALRNPLDQADLRFRVIPGEGDNYPMYYVSRQEAIDFIDKLNDSRDGYTYRLPSESEWEYACRADTTGPYAGDLQSIAWYGDNSCKPNCKSEDADLKWNPKDSDNQYKLLIAKGAGTHPVCTASNPRNKFGLCDMLGNVWEWCADWYHESYQQVNRPDNGDPWLTASRMKERVRRGSSWNDGAAIVRCANRGYTSAGEYRSSSTGFRVVATPRSP
jgi:formylglycine-generating enzyme required for sulfatase activity